MSGELRQRAEAYLARGSAEPIAWASDELLLAAIDADERIVQVGNCQMVPFAIPLYRDAPDEAATIIRELLASCAELEQAAKSEHRCRMREAELAFSITQQRAELLAALEPIRHYFRSANGIPVERATVKASEWAAVEAVIAKGRP
ncbi:MAG TPA: hypothetical protein DDW98_08915 [Gammaproteobacteria bacterium]|jgi:hypothetical protein|nr:hypothetical protein [Gammaproteobacteria bacterium]